MPKPARERQHVPQGAPRSGRAGRRSAPRAKAAAAADRPARERQARARSRRPRASRRPRRRSRPARRERRRRAARAARPTRRGRRRRAGTRGSPSPAPARSSALRAASVIAWPLPMTLLAAHHRRAGRAGDLGRGVGRAVVGHEDARRREGRGERGQRRADAIGLVVRGDDHDRPRPSTGRPRPRVDRAGRLLSGPSWIETRMAEVQAHITGTVWKIECAVGDRSRRATRSRSSSR